MQDRQAGDVGDFLKFGLLRSLVAGDPALRLGVNWYRTPDESATADTRHVSYLNPANRQHQSLHECDPDLMERLQVMVAQKRSLEALEASGVLPAGSIAYRAELPYGLSDEARRAWHAAALDALRGADVVFVDPDNGVCTRTADSSASKFAFLDELADYAGRDQSLVVYQHADRTRWGFVDARVPRLLTELAAGTGLDPVGAVVGHRGSTRAFAIVATRDHCDVLAARLSSHARRWSSHTTLVDVAQRR